MILKEEIIYRLSEKLSLPYTGTEQDWDLEMANPDRINEFLHFYNQAGLGPDEKEAVMALVLASYDDFLDANDLDSDKQWNTIKPILQSEKVIFSDLLEYWSLKKELDENNLFRITPLVRQI